MGASLTWSQTTWQSLTIFSRASILDGAASLTSSSLATSIVLEVGFLSAAAGVAIVVLALPLQIYFGKRFARQRRRTAKWTDKRVRKTAELLTGVVSMKANCWEEPSERFVGKLRKNESASIMCSMSMKSFNAVLSFATPYASSMLTFLSFWMTGAALSIDTVFSTMALIHVLRLSIGANLTFFLESALEASVSVERMRRFLLRDEKARVHPAEQTEGQAPTLSINDATFSFDSGSGAATGGAAVRGITIDAQPGEIIIICGRSGSGKQPFWKESWVNFLCNQEHAICAARLPMRHSSLAFSLDPSSRMLPGTRNPLTKNFSGMRLRKHSWTI